MKDFSNFGLLNSCIMTLGPKSICYTHNLLVAVSHFGIHTVRWKISGQFCKRGSLSPIWDSGTCCCIDLAEGLLIFLISTGRKPYLFEFSVSQNEIGKSECRLRLHAVSKTNYQISNRMGRKSWYAGFCKTPPFKIRRGELNHYTYFSATFSSIYFFYGKK